ncbi:MAG: TonB-dependent receptor [Acidobacteriota bacterium]
MRHISCPSDGDAPARVETLGEALELLRREGVEIVYTSRLVDASTPVDGLPCSGSPEERLRTLLAPMGLEARADAGGPLVVRLARRGSLEGTIRAEPGGQPIAFAQVRLLPDGETSLTNDDGRFELHGLTAGSKSVIVSRPGYLARRWRLSVDVGSRQQLDATLRLAAETSEEILVGATPLPGPLGSWRPSPEATRDALAIDQDVLAAAARLPGTVEGQGVAFGVRGHDAERLTLVVDGIDIAEPYHFRDLGSLAGAVTPTAVDAIRLHRGSPPVFYGDCSGGILEVLTRTTGSRISARLGAGDESLQALLGGTNQGNRLRWLVAYRQGAPDLPPAGADLNQVPAYWDGLAKLTLVLRPRHELTLQTLQVADDLSVLFQDPFVRALTIDQDSQYSQVRSLASLGTRHVLDTRVSHSEIDQRRFGQEQEAAILTPPETDEDFVLDDRRSTRRTTGRIDGTSSLRVGLESRWGVETSRETTRYDYLLFAPFRTPPVPGPGDFPVIPTVFFADTIDQTRSALYSQATWRPREALTLSGGLRFDEDALGDGSAIGPRLDAAVRTGSAVWRIGWARVRDAPDSHQLLLADGDERPPGVETSDYVSLGSTVRRGAHTLSVEIYHQRIDRPRRRFENLFQSVSRVPELEHDRVRVEAEVARNQGLEARWDYRRSSGLRASATYGFGRFEDRLADGTWRPRRSDRRHALDLALAVRLPFEIEADVLWRSASGRRITPLDLDLARQDLELALGPIHSQRLPPVHRLDVRISRAWQSRGTTLRAGVGVDDLFDRRNVRGLDLLPLRAEGPPPSALPEERDLGRTLRWSLELSW